MKNTLVFLALQAIILIAFWDEVCAGSDQKIKSVSSARSNVALRIGPMKTITTSSTSRGLKTTSIFTAVKDEVVDIWDSLAYAESNKERFENAAEILRRHKTTIGLAGGLLTSVAFAKFLASKRYSYFVSFEILSTQCLIWFIFLLRGKDLGKDYLREMRRKEIEKWGRRNGLWVHLCVSCLLIFFNNFLVLFFQHCFLDAIDFIFLCITHDDDLILYARMFYPINAIHPWCSVGGEQLWWFPIASCSM